MTGCNVQDDGETNHQTAVESDREIHHYFVKNQQSHQADWSYEGDTGPDHWGDLDSAFRVARDGKHQSPINIDSSAARQANLPPLRFEYQEERISWLNNGHTIQHNESPGSFLYIGDESFSLEQFHAHVPSEHTINGKHADMELHFVHKSETGQVVVVALMVNGSEAANVLSHGLFRELPKQMNEVVESRDIYGNPAEFMPNDVRYFVYDGSFTTPPCTEQVHWIVLEPALNVVPDLIESVGEILKGNNRPVQELNDRIIQIPR